MKAHRSGIWSDAPQRLLTTAIGLPIILGVIIIGAPLSTLVIIGVSGIAIYELYRLSQVQKKWLWLFCVAVSLYICLPMLLLNFIRDGADGMLWTLFLLVTNWSTDTFALIGGRLFGKRKLAPRISAGKTWEGAIIGFLSGCCAGWIVGNMAELPLHIILIASPIIALMTILGDLLESQIKRFFNAKDAGQLLPGHGGFLDRIDGLLLAIPPFYILMHL